MAEFLAPRVTQIWKSLLPLRVKIQDGALPTRQHTYDTLVIERALRIQAVLQAVTRKRGGFGIGQKIVNPFEKDHWALDLVPHEVESVLHAPLDPHRTHTLAPRPEHVVIVDESGGRRLEGERGLGLPPYPAAAEGVPGAVCHPVPFRDTSGAVHLASRVTISVEYKWFDYAEEEEAMGRPKNEFSRQFSDESFWEKLVGFARAAGAEVVERALQLYYAAQDPETPPWAKATVYGALGYFIVPVDAIPDFIPAAGYTDDLGVLAAAVATVAMHITPSVKKAARRKMRDWFE